MQVSGWLKDTVRGKGHAASVTDKKVFAIVRMNMSQSESITPDELYRLVRLTLKRVNNEVAALFEAGLPDVEQLSKKTLTASSLPVIECVPRVGRTSEHASDLVEAIKKCYSYQSWRQPYTSTDFGSQFFNRSAWFPIADVDGPIVYNTGLVEVMLLDAGLTYPKHKHNPEELYVVLAGKVWWEAETVSYIWRQAGEVIHHSPNQIHSITAGEEPVLILNLWRGGSFEIPEII